jgi:hypothetical protein
MKDILIKISHEKIFEPFLKIKLDRLMIKSPKRTRITPWMLTKSEIKLNQTSAKFTSSLFMCGFWFQMSCRLYFEVCSISILKKDFYISLLLNCSRNRSLFCLIRVTRVPGLLTHWSQPPQPADVYQWCQKLFLIGLISGL